VAAGSSFRTLGPIIKPASFNLYQAIADSWQLYDNSTMGHLIPITSKMSTGVEVSNAAIWQKLNETYNETSKE